MTFSKQVLLALAPALASGAFLAAARGEKPGSYDPEKNSGDANGEWESVQFVDRSKPTPAEAIVIQENQKQKEQAARVGWDLVDQPTFGEIHPTQGWKSKFN